jgi:peptide/nickel transport system ATP-binding protein
MVCAMPPTRMDKRNNMTDNQQNPILSVHDLRMYFYPDDGIVKAVDGASFDLYAGRTLGIVGESGCGKSATARTILRIEEYPGRIEGGEILLYPQDGGKPYDLTQFNHDDKLLRSIRGGEIALVFQEPMTSFSAHYTIGNQIIEMIRLHNNITQPEAKNRAIELLRQVGIPKPERRIDEYPFQLSGGLRQRVMIAMALANKPRILIADEPTTALDVTTQAQILELMRELQEQYGMAIIIITHDMGVIAEMADDVAVMYLGKVVESGSVDDIFHNPQHPYTAALLKSIPNIMAKPKTRLPTLSGAIPHPYNRPTGCSFHPRCSEFMIGKCDVWQPTLQPVNDHQQVSCFLYHDPITNDNKEWKTT